MAPPVVAAKSTTTANAINQTRLLKDGFRIPGGQISKVTGGASMKTQ